MSERIVLDGIAVDVVTGEQVVATVRAALDRSEGGRIVTPNVDILRQARTDPAVRGYLDDATLVVADGTPLVWASKLAGTPLPERVTGSDLIWSLSAGLAADGRSIFVLGGEPADPGFVDGAGRAAFALSKAYPGLRVAGWRSPDYGFERDEYALASVCREVVEAKPDLVYVGIGFPKQEWLISLLRPELPGTWFLGCGAAVNFAAGDQQRAPEWMQRAGLEWAHRLGHEPRRLARRYLGHDAPYAVNLMIKASFKSF